MATYAEQLRQMIQHLGRGPVTVLGSSLGGSAAITSPSPPVLTSGNTSAATCSTRIDVNPFSVAGKLVDHSALLGGLMAYPVNGAGGPQVVEFVRVHNTVRMDDLEYEVKTKTRRSSAGCAPGGG